MHCPECAHPLHAKVSRYGLRFFAHDPGSPTCALAGESMEHHLLKLELATVVRAATTPDWRSAGRAGKSPARALRVSASSSSPRERR